MKDDVDMTATLYIHDIFRNMDGKQVYLHCSKISAERRVNAGTRKVSWISGNRSDCFQDQFAPLWKHSSQNGGGPERVQHSSADDNLTLASDDRQMTYVSHPSEGTVKAQARHQQ